MRKKFYQYLLTAIIFIIPAIVNTQNSLATNKNVIKSEQKQNAIKYKVTFIELGSVRCIPCKKMEAVLDSIRKKYPKNVKVIFYDVWTEAGKQYGVKSIPTQVFLDANSKEYYRHVGFFPETKLIKILEQKGVKE